MKRLALVASLVFACFSIAPAAVGPLEWSQLPGTASRVTVAPDGTLFALSTAPAGADKNILHYEAGHWTSVPGLTASSIAVGPTGTLYASAPNGVYAYDAGVWKPLGRAGFGGVTAAGDGSIYALGSAADTTGNRVIWRKLGAGLWTRQAATGEFLAASFDQATYAVPGVGAVKPDGYFVVKSTGAISYWLPNGTSVSFPGTASAVAPVPGGFFALQFPLATSGAHLTYFDYATARTTAQTEVARGLAAGHGAGGPWTQLYAVSAAADVFTTVPTLSVTPKFSEFPLPTKSAGPYGIAVGPDGALWFAEAFTASVGRITTAGKISEKVVFSPAKDYELAPDFIATGSDGALWYTTEFNGVIGRVTTGGVPSQFEINKKSSEPTGIAAGPDGALWFTDPFFEPKIGRITTAGVINEYAISTAAPLGIAAGPDGALWITFVGSKIGRITTAGHLTEFAIVNKTGHSADPTTIVAGPDGALWFTEDQGNRIGRITTAGTITEFAVPTASSGPVALAAGPDGALWFEETNAGKFGRITTAGVITEYKLPAPDGGAAGIVTGPDGALWFTDTKNDAIGRVSLF